MSDKKSLPGTRKPAPVVANDDGLLTSYEEVGERIISIVESVLCSQCDADETALGAGDIREILGALRHVPGLMPKLLHGLIAPHQVMRFVRDPLSRALVEPFSHRLEKPGGPSLDDGALSRRFLPGFFVAIRLMIGGERYDIYQAACDKALAEEQLASDVHPSSPQFWTALFQRNDLQVVTAEVYARFFLRFDPYEKRKAWFIKLINTKLAALPSAEADGEASRWRFDETHFREMAQTMLGGSKGLSLERIAEVADKKIGAAEAQRILKIAQQIQDDR